MLKYILSALLSLSLTTPAFAQSQGANGAIEGTVSDTSGGVLPGVTVTITNVDTGAERSVVTNEKGLYRAPLLPLGKYRVVAELQGFKKFDGTDIQLSVGQTATVNATLSVGTVSETITVSSSDIPALDIARIDIGHTMSELEVHNLPLVARNPYNFALVQPGVTGIENVEFGVPRLAANGAAMRINYQIDGNTNTEKDRAGLRLLPMSEVMIQEVKVVTTGFAPEFGQTMGMVYNAVTPSGTNTFKGEASYLFRRKPFSAFPFFFGCGSTTIAANCPAITAGPELKPDTKADTGTADVGGPIVKNKLFFYGGWEQTRRDLSSSSLITVSTVDRRAGRRQGAADGGAERPDRQVQDRQGRLPGQQRHPPDDAVDPVPQRRAVQQRRRHRDARARHRLPRRDGLDRRPARELAGEQQAERAPLPVRAPAPELGRRTPIRAPARRSRSATPAISFGAPVGGTGQGNAGFDFKQDITQVIDNFTYIRAAHSYKFGFDWQHIYDERTNAPQFSYTFPTRHRVSGGEGRHRAVRLHHDVADYRQSVVQHEHGRLQHLRAGRLADLAEGQDPLRPALRPLQVSGRHRRRAARLDARVQHRQEQLRAARRRRLGAGPEDGAAREHRHHVRPADPRRLRAGAAVERLAALAGLQLQRHVARRAGVSRAAPPWPAPCRSSRPGRSIRNSRWRTRGRRNAQLERVDRPRSDRERVGRCTRRAASCRW